MLPRFKIRGTTERVFRTLPIGGKPTSLDFDVPPVGCLCCHAVRQVNVPFAEPKKHYTRSFERYALELSRRMTIPDVANHL
jgi:transposase